jgi:alginate O-acetyltransferase complex protein AlgI
MLFNSFHFFIFFPTVVALYFLLPQRIRWVFLLVASYYFYMCWKAEYIVLLATSTLSAYVAAIIIARSDKKRTKKIALFSAITINIGLLFVFKYLNFFNESIRFLCDSVNIFYAMPSFRVLLPVGISFYTFQIVGYLIDVYREDIKPEKHLGIFAVYVSFFPQLVSGPIERASSFLPQFYEKHHFDYERVKNGLLLMLWGLFKKVVIADRLALMVDHVYADPTNFTGLPLIVAAVGFSFQVYCDFSGYTDIAIGAGRVMGFRLMKNFDRPYISKSITEFWQRWHISLSTWVRDYVFLPLAIKKKSWANWGIAFSSMVSFLLMGLWHGANWTFVVFGLLHGVAVSYELLTKKYRLTVSRRVPPKVYNGLCLLATFSFVSFAMIFFRADTFADAFYIITHLFADFEFSLPSIKAFSGFDFIFSILLVIFLEFVQSLNDRKPLTRMIASQPVAVRWSLYYSIVFMLIMFGVFTKRTFVYFQF